MPLLFAFTTPGHLTLGFVAALIALCFAARKCLKPSQRQQLLFIALTMFSHHAPDLDVLTYAVGLDHGHPFGHRGIFHSYVVGLAVGAGLAVAAVRLAKIQVGFMQFAFLALWFAAGPALHITADMACDCDQRVMCLFPFSTERFLFSPQYLVIPRFTFNIWDGTPLRAFLVELRLIFVWVVVPFAGFLLLSSERVGGRLVIVTRRRAIHVKAIAPRGRVMAPVAK